MSLSRKWLKIEVNLQYIINRISYQTFQLAASTMTYDDLDRLF